MKSNFDYESKPFGVGAVRLSPWYIPALKLRYALKALKGARGRILEIGCGGGAMVGAMNFYRPDLEFYACDISEVALSYAKKDFPKVKFSYGDVYKLPFKDNYFDAVVAFDLLEHLENPKKALAQVKRVLKKEGIIHFAIPYEGSLTNLEGIMTRLGWRAKKIYCGHVKQFFLGELEKLIERQGFRKVERKYSTHLIYQIVDAAYFSFIELRGKNFPYQVEGYVSVNRGFWRNLLLLLKSLFAITTYIESSLLFWFPGMTGHLTYRKN